MMMSSPAGTNIATNQTATDLTATAERAKRAGRRLATLPDERRTAALLAAASAIERQSARILEANALDSRLAAQLVAEGKMSQALYDRLQTSERGVAGMAARVR